MKDVYTLKITSAVLIAGKIHKAGALVDVSESVAKLLLGRGKAVIATVDDVTALPVPTAEEKVTAPAETDTEEAAEATEEKAAKKGAKK